MDGSSAKKIKKNPKTYENQKARQNEILRPINYLYLPLRDQSMIATVYKEFSEKESSKCLCCPLSFANKYIRDYHMTNIHNLQLQYMCYECENNTDLDESDIYFTTVYELHIHKIENHNESGYNLNTYILM